MRKLLRRMVLLFPMTLIWIPIILGFFTKYSIIPGVLPLIYLVYTAVFYVAVILNYFLQGLFSRKKNKDESRLVKKLKLLAPLAIGVIICMLLTGSIEVFDKIVENDVNQTNYYQAILFITSFVIFLSGVKLSAVHESKLISRAYLIAFCNLLIITIVLQQLNNMHVFYPKLDAIRSVFFSIFIIAYLMMGIYIKADEKQSFYNEAGIFNASGKLTQFKYYAYTITIVAILPIMFGLLVFPGLYKTFISSVKSMFFTLSSINSDTATSQAEEQTKSAVLEELLKKAPVNKITINYELIYIAFIAIIIIILITHPGIIIKIYNAIRSLLIRLGLIKNKDTQAHQEGLYKERTTTIKRSGARDKTYEIKSYEQFVKIMTRIKDPGERLTFGYAFLYHSFMDSHSSMSRGTTPNELLRFINAEYAGRYPKLDTVTGLYGVLKYRESGADKKTINENILAVCELVRTRVFLLEDKA